ncbi:MAG: DUF1273 family protein [Clostridia bacterium]|nr:DUF1273 family protein [Clostridia bacterium]
MEKENTACFTGHRTIPTESLPEILSRLYSTVAQLILQGYDTFICGGAVGFDTEAAECVLAMKTRFPHVKLVLALPCRDQTVKWTNESDLFRYKKILGQADDVKYIRTFYAPGCMHERNRWMTAHASACVAYLTAMRGGAYYTFNHASKHGLKTINIAETAKRKDIQ